MTWRIGKGCKLLRYFLASVIHPPLLTQRGNRFCQLRLVSPTWGVEWIDGAKVYLPLPPTLTTQLLEALFSGGEGQIRVSGPPTLRDSEFPLLSASESPGDTGLGHLRATYG